MADDAPAAPAGWYPHPEMADTVSYWSGEGWTGHVAPLAGRAGEAESAVDAATYPADWYPHPTRPGMVRYYDGTEWTDWVSRAGSEVMAQESEMLDAEECAREVASWRGVVAEPSQPQQASSRLDHVPVALGGRPLVGSDQQRSQIVCQFCQEQGCVTARRVPRVKRKTATRIVGGVATLGGSLLLTGVSKKGTVTEMSCSNCGMSWDV